MKVAALATQIGRDEGVSKLYMLNQNYAYGQAFQAAAQKFLGERAPNVELVGDELIVPFGKVLDFTPYIAKIKASGADTVLTGNWGPDLVRFVKAAAAAGLQTPFYTIYAGLPSSIAGFGGMWTLAKVGELMYGREALGMGDVKLMGAIGAWQGLHPTLLLTVFLGAAIGSVFGIAHMVRHGRDKQAKLPFGPLLCLGALLSWVWGDVIWARMMGL